MSDLFHPPVKTRYTVLTRRSFKKLMTALQNARGKHWESHTGISVTPKGQFQVVVSKQE